MNNLRVGIVGMGAMGRNHARVIESLDGVELVGISDPLCSKPSHPIANVPWYQSLSQLLKLNLDYCVISAPTVEHFNIAVQLAESGVHALIEKPVTFKSEEAYKLEHVFSSKGLVASVGHVERYNPAVQEARSRIINGELGRIYQIETRRLSPFPNRIKDVGVAYDLATHDIDIAMWLTGQKYCSVFAKTAGHLGNGVEDLVTVMASLTDSTIVTHSVSWLSPYKERKIVILGEQGIFTVDTLTVDLTYFSNGSMPIRMNELAYLRGASEGSTIRYAIPKVEPLVLQHEAFRDSVIGKPAEIVTLGEAAEVIRVVETIFASAHRGTAISLN